MKSIAVIGLGEFGHQVAIGLTQKGFEVVAVDQKEEIITEIKDLVSQAIMIDATDEKSMRSINIDNVDKAIVAIGSNVQSSLLSTALLQRMQINDIYVRTINSLQESILRTMGVKHVISIEKEMGTQVANTMVSDGIGRYIEISDRHSLIEVVVPHRFVKKSLKDLRLRAEYGINIVGIKVQKPVVDDHGDIRMESVMTDIPDPDYPLNKDDILIMAGTDENLKTFIEYGQAS